MLPEERQIADDATYRGAKLSKSTSIVYIALPILPRSLTRHTKTRVTRHVKRRGKRKRTSNSRVTTPSFASRKFSSLNNKFNINYNPFLTFFELLTQCTFVIARLKLLVWNCLFEHECEYITIKRSEILFTLQWIKDITVIIVLIKFEINVYKSGGIFIAIYISSKRIVWSLK